jgi:hypothetical protein
MLRFNQAPDSHYAPRTQIEDSITLHFNNMPHLEG